MLTKKDSNPKNDTKSTATKAVKTSNDQQTTTTSPIKSPKQYTTNTTKNPVSSQDSLFYDKKDHKTKITIKYDVGFPNQLYIRGKGANLSWEKGQALRNTKNDEWVWENESTFSQCEFKVLINDKQYETGENHHITPGSTVIYSPRF